MIHWEINYIKIGNKIDHYSGEKIKMHVLDITKEGDIDALINNLDLM